jgi:hypothetical protein
MMAGPPGGGGMGMMGGPGGMMGGPGGRMGGAGAAAPGTDVFGPLGSSQNAPVAPIQDFATSAAAYTDDPQWSELDERYEVSMEWARQIDLKWQPIRKAELHYHLAALGLALARPSADWAVLHPEQLDREARRIRERYVDAYVAAQRNLIPAAVMENLKESARLAVERKTRLRGATPEPTAPAAPAAEAGGAPAAPLLGAGPGGAPSAAPGAPAAADAPKPTPEDIAAFERRCAEELEYLIYVYLVGYDAAPWFRTAYEPSERTFDANGVPQLEKHEPKYYHSDSGEGTTSTTSTATGSRGMAGPGGMMPGMGPGGMGGGSGGGRPGMGAMGGPPGMPAGGMPRPAQATGGAGGH